MKYLTIFICLMLAGCGTMNRRQASLWMNYGQTQHQINQQNNASKYDTTHYYQDQFRQEAESIKSWSYDDYSVDW